MGVINQMARAPIQALGAAAEGVSQVFIPHATRQMELSAETYLAALETAAAEFEHAGPGWFDRAINGLNRLPRPFLALGTLGLFGYAMVDPDGFAVRMRGLSEVPEPLWWLLGAIVGFYFGARELHYRRQPGFLQRRGARGARSGAPADPVAENPALSAWRAEASEVAASDVDPV